MQERQNERSIDAARDFFADDLFATQATGAIIDSLGQDSAVCSCDIVAGICNANGGVMGGALYTLADYSAAVALWQPGVFSCTVDSSMQFLARAKGTRLIAHATPERRGRTISYMHVEIQDDLGTKVACGHLTLLTR